jgi:pyruvate kinase
MRTKIIATIGPASNTRPVLSKLVEAGVRIFRLNFSHGNSSMFVDIIKLIREVEAEYGVPITIMQDLSGPKIRIGNLKDNAAYTVAAGDMLLLGPTSRYCDELPYIPFDQEAILRDIEPGDKLILADGTLQFTVKSKRPDGLFEIQAGNAGIITSRKGLALPGKQVNVPALTDKDKTDLRDGLKLGVDAVALSFVQTADDIREAKSIIRESGRKDVPVVAKLERRNAVEHLDSILEETDVVMVARGDLGIECSLAELPGMQKRIILACNKAAKPVIVATQMLLSMVNNPSPTRAETTDVANAVLDGADCVMLSEETAMGQYPVETVGYMKDITTHAEALLHERDHVRFVPGEDRDIQDFLAYSACLMSERIHSKAMIIHSITGKSARLIASHRPAQIIYSLTPYNPIMKWLNFTWGVLPVQVEHADEIGHLKLAEQFIASSPQFLAGEEFIVTAGQPTTTGPRIRGTNLIKIYRK